MKREGLRAGTWHERVGVDMVGQGMCEARAWVGLGMGKGRRGSMRLGKGGRTVLEPVSGKRRARSVRSGRRWDGRAVQEVCRVYELLSCLGGQGSSRHRTGRGRRCAAWDRVGFRAGVVGQDGAAGIEPGSSARLGMGEWTGVRATVVGQHWPWGFEMGSSARLGRGPGGVRAGVVGQAG